MKLGLNLVGPHVRKWRFKKGWTQEKLAQKLQRLGWSVSRHSPEKLQLGLRRVPDCEAVFLANVLGAGIKDLFPKRIAFKKVGPAFQAGKRFSLYPTRGGSRSAILQANFSAASSMRYLCQAKCGAFWAPLK